MLKNAIEHLITEVIEKNLNGFDIEITVEKDEVPLHYDRDVRNYLAINYRDR